MRIIEVTGLGYEAVKVNIDGGEKVLFMDSALDVDTRIEMLTAAMDED